MTFQVFVVGLVVCGMATSLQSASVGSSVKTNDTEISARSGRTYDDPQQYISIPIGYFKPEQESAGDAEKDDDSSPKYDVPTSFDDFMPSDKLPRKKYPMYSKSKGVPPSWKGDLASGNVSPTWMFPSPADMAMMMSVMKGMNGDQNTEVPEEPTGLLSKLTSDPVAFIGAIMLPAAVLLAAVLPIIVSMFTNSDGGSIPTVTTVATGNSARRLSDNPTFVKPILEMIDNFNARSVSEHSCMQKSFCEATRGGNSTEFRPIQKSIYKAFTFVDDYWLEALGVKQLMEAMGNGNCDTIHCDASKAGDPDSMKKRL